MKQIATFVVLNLAGLCLFCSCGSRSTLREPLPHVSEVSKPEFARGMAAMFGPDWAEGNKVTILNNGDATFSAMLAAIRGARHTINFETFVYWKGDTPERFAQALAERARAGVTVNLLVDGVGGRKSKTYHKELEAAGVNVVMYLPPGLLSAHKSNYRTHRKVLVVDGKIGFTGGLGIGDEWNGNARNEKEWRDTHYRFEGPIVAQWQGVFADNWLEAKHEVLQGPHYYPPLSRAGNARASTVQSEPIEGRSNAELVYHMAIANASESILLETPYFIPDDTLMKAMEEATRRGVKIQVILPGHHNDNRMVRRASQRRWPKLLAAGVRIFEYQPTFLHSKLLIVDGRFVSVGSINFDPRSMQINDEANLNVLDPAFAREHTEVFLQDLRRSKEVPPTWKADHSPGSLIKGLFNAPQHAMEIPVESQL